MSHGIRAIALASCRFIAITFRESRYHCNHFCESWCCHDCFLKLQHLCDCSHELLVHRNHFFANRGIITVALATCGIIAVAFATCGIIAVSFVTCMIIAIALCAGHPCNCSCELPVHCDRFCESLGVAVALGNSCYLCNHLHDSQIHCSRLL